MATSKKKDVSLVDQVLETPFTFDVLKEKLLGTESKLGPREKGRVDMIVLRPEINERTVVKEAVVSREGGLSGSGWVHSEEKGYTDQICVMSTNAIRAIAGIDEKDWPPAGDNLFVDLDLSKENLPIGTRVRIGGFEGEVTKKPHNGCAKFSKRYGIDALKAVSMPLSKQRRLRGIYFEVVKEGIVKEGDEVVVLSRPAKDVEGK